MTIGVLQSNKSKFKTNIGRVDKRKCESCVFLSTGQQRVKLGPRDASLHQKLVWLLGNVHILNLASRLHASVTRRPNTWRKETEGSDLHAPLCQFITTLVCRLMGMFIIIQRPRWNTATLALKLLQARREAEDKAFQGGPHVSYSASLASGEKRLGCLSNQSKTTFRVQKNLLKLLSFLLTL